MTLAEKNYRDWLIDIVNIVEGRDYTELLRILYGFKFVPLINYDGDRAADGVSWREVWADEFIYNGSLDWGECNVLELLFGVATRIEFQNFGSQYAEEWTLEMIFWDMINNLGLMEFDGKINATESVTIGNILYIFCNREYKRHKKGNIFILFDTNKDLSKMAIWDQIKLYIREKWPKTGFLEF